MAETTSLLVLKLRRVFKRHKKISYKFIHFLKGTQIGCICDGKRINVLITIYNSNVIMQNILNFGIIL